MPFSLVRFPGKASHAHPRSVVEDEPTAQSLVKRALQEKGYDVVVARDGSDALACLTRESFDLVISDVVVPVMGEGRSWRKFWPVDTPGFR